MREVLLRLQNSSPWRAGGEARDVSALARGGMRAGAGQPAAGGMGAAAGGMSRYWIPVRSRVPRAGSCSWDRECRAGFQARTEPGAGSACPGTGCVPSSQRVEQPETGCTWRCGGMAGVLAPRAPAHVSTPSGKRAFAP